MQQREPLAAEGIPVLINCCANKVLSVKGQVAASVHRLTMNVAIVLVLPYMGHT